MLGNGAASILHIINPEGGGLLHFTSLEAASPCKLLEITHGRDCHCNNKEKADTRID